MEQKRGMKRVLFALTRFILDIFPQNMVIKSICIRLTGLVIQVVMWYKSAPFLKAWMSPNVFGIFLSMNLLVAQKKIVNIPLDHQRTGTEFPFCVTRGILFRLASPYSEPNRKKAFCWPVHFELKHPPWLSMKKREKTVPISLSFLPNKTKICTFGMNQIMHRKKSNFLKVKFVKI